MALPAATTPARSLLLLLLACAIFCRHAPAQAPSPEAERALFQLTNQLRAEHHLPPLAWDPALALVARHHAQRLLAEPGPLEHQYPGEPDLVTRAARAGAHFSTISENLARQGTSPADLLAAWMATPIHRANLLDPQLTAIGIGIVTGHGLLYAVQDLSRAAPILTHNALEAHIADLLQAQGLTSVSASAQARTACEQHATSAGDARLVVQWDGDATRLPPALIDQLDRAHYQGAAVGVCDSTQPATGFTSARVAVLLF